jgi:hypothetical protein
MTDRQGQMGLSEWVSMGTVSEKGKNRAGSDRPCLWTAVVDASGSAEEGRFHASDRACGGGGPDVFFRACWLWYCFSQRSRRVTAERKS